MTLSPASVDSSNSGLWVLSVGTLVEGTHFLASAGDDAIAHKALAVNLSDMAAMGALPVAANAVLVADDQKRAETLRGWLRMAAASLVETQSMHLDSRLVRGAGLSITIEILGQVPDGAPLRRNGAQAGDDIYVSGTLGDAGAGLALQRHEIHTDPLSADWLLQRLHRPTPRLALGRALVGIASACIDISDGLLSDLGHICKASAVDASIDSPSLPLSTALAQAIPVDRRAALALTGGDDYELCFCVPTTRRTSLRKTVAQLGCGITRIGSVLPPSGGDGPGRIQVDGSTRTELGTGYDHFRAR